MLSPMVDLSNSWTDAVRYWSEPLISFRWPSLRTLPETAERRLQPDLT